MSCLCATFITAYFVSFSSLCLCLLLFPPSLCPHPLCPFLLLPFQFISSLVTPPSPPLLCPVRPSSGLRPPQPLRLLVLFPGLKPSQTISCLSRQRPEDMRRSVSGMHDVMKQRGSPNALLTKCQHAHSISPFPLSFCLLSSGLHHHHYGFVWLPKGEWGIQLEWGILPIVFLSLRNSTKCNAFCLRQCKLNPQTKRFYQLLFPHHITRKKQQQYSEALCPAFSTFSHLNLWMLGLTRLPLSSSRPNTKMSGSGM